VTQVPGNNGNIKKAAPRALVRGMEKMGIWKRATNVNEDFVSHIVTRKLGGLCGK
jgi:hypothetical protein